MVLTIYVFAYIRRKEEEEEEEEGAEGATYIEEE